MAAALYNKLTGTHNAISAGTEPTIGKPIHETVLEVLKDYSIETQGLFRKDVYRMIERKVKTLVEKHD
jgi:protein-tyrosine-phosphatase